MVLIACERGRRLTLRRTTKILLLLRGSGTGGMVPRRERTRGGSSERRPKGRVIARTENESVATVYSAAGRHLAVDGRDPDFGHRRLPVSSPFGAAGSRLSNNSSRHVL